MRSTGPWHVVQPTPFVQVDAVVEVDEVRQIVHARPLDRAARAEAGADRFEERAVGEDLRMAVHARLGRRNAREGGVLDRRVAVAAVDAIAGDVALVAELDRLFARDVRLGHPGRAVDRVGEPEQAGDDEDGAEDADTGDRVGAAMKDLRHRSGRSKRSVRELSCQAGVELRRGNTPPNERRVSLPCFGEEGDSYFVKDFTSSKDSGRIVPDFRQSGAFSQV